MASSDNGGCILIIIAAAAIYSCSNDSTEKTDEQEEVASQLGVSEDEAAELLEGYDSAEDAIADYRTEEGKPFDEDEARDEAERELAASGYDYRYGCTEDCSGHQAGWQWRSDHGYSTYGKSQSFEEGGRAFDEAVEERVDELRDEYEAGEEP